MASSRTKEETDLQSRIIDALGRIGVWVMRMSVSVRRDGMTTVNCGEPGMPDLWTPLGWIEVKLPGKECQPDQVKWHAKAARNGVRVTVVSSVEQSIRVYMGWRKDAV